jgi:hypothetical protein
VSGTDELSGTDRRGTAERRGGRWAWRLAGSLLAVPVLLFGATQVALALAHEDRTTVTTVDAAGLRTLDVRNSTGAIHLVGVEGADSVTVRARISDGWRATGHRVRHDGDRLEVTASCPAFGSTFCRVNYTIEMPSDLTVVARGDAAITASDLTNRVDASTDNGRIELARVSGDVRVGSDNGSVTATELRASSVRASSDNGGVRVELVEPPRTVRATSDNGSVEVVLPRTDDLYRLTATSDNGTVSTPVRTDPESERGITATSDNGDVTVHYSAG